MELLQTKRNEAIEVAELLLAEIILIYHGEEAVKRIPFPVNPHKGVIYSGKANIKLPVMVYGWIRNGDKS